MLPLRCTLMMAMMAPAWWRLACRLLKIGGSAQIGQKGHAWKRRLKRMWGGRQSETRHRGILFWLMRDSHGQRERRENKRKGECESVCVGASACVKCCLPSTFLFLMRWHFPKHLASLKPFRSTGRVAIKLPPAALSKALLCNLHTLEIAAEKRLDTVGNAPLALKRDSFTARMHCLLIVCIVISKIRLGLIALMLRSTPCGEST